MLKECQTMPRTAATPPAHKYSLLSKDAEIGTGLFSDGPAVIEEAVFTKYDYGGTVRGGTVVLLVKYARGEGREDKETYEQPYSTGKGWDLDKKGDLTHVNGKDGKFQDSCNMMRHFIHPFEKALKSANIALPDAGINEPAVFEGMQVVLERVPQKVWNDPKRPVRPPREGEDVADDRGPKTILQIREVVSVPWSAPADVVKKAKPNGRVQAPEPAPVEEEEEDEDDTAVMVARARATTAARKAAAKGAGPAPAVAPAAQPGGEGDGQGDLTEEATEAIIALVEDGPIPVAKLEVLLEKSLGQHPQAPAIIDLATSARFLRREMGWTLSKDGKTLDAQSAE
jgi:hypothetical protein